MRVREKEKEREFAHIQKGCEQACLQDSLCVCSIQYTTVFVAISLVVKIYECLYVCVRL